MGIIHSRGRVFTAISWVHNDLRASSRHPPRPDARRRTESQVLECCCACRCFCCRLHSDGQDRAWIACVGAFTWHLNDSSHPRALRHAACKCLPEKQCTTGRARPPVPEPGTLQPMAGCPPMTCMLSFCLSCSCALRRTRCVTMLRRPNWPFGTELIATPSSTFSSNCPWICHARTAAACRAMHETTREKQLPTRFRSILNAQPTSPQTPT